MITRLLVATAAVMATVSLASAADTPSDTKSCMEQVFALAQTAQTNKLADDKLTKAEELMTKMEDYCTAEKFADAAKVSEELSQVVSK